ncbi:hypothetical protein Micbo1qcDRAFT_111839, partial [Microdochium bolleyi]
QLSLCKQKTLRSLLTHGEIVRALDKLYPFPGLWGGLHLGNIHRHLAIHCDEQIISYINHIETVWGRITNGHIQARGCADLHTVKFLQFKAPGVCETDRLSITKAMNSGNIFSLITNDRIRQRILINILSLKTVIPSIATFHENMKYFSIGAKILRNVFKFESTSTLARDPPSLLQQFCKRWQCTPSAMIEVGPNIVHSVPTTANARLAFIVLFIAALRQFDTLSAESPLQDHHRAGKT